jgi:HTH-type transcriptional regulator/antitoxin HigA
MNIKPIRTKAAYKQAMARIDALWGARTGSPDGDELEVRVMLVERYEAQHQPMPPSDPIEAIKFRMDQQGLTARDLEPYIGSSGRVSEVLNGKRRLSLAMVKRLHDGLHIPYESLLSGAG